MKNVTKKENEYLDKLVSLLVDKAIEDIQKERILKSSKTSKTLKK